VLKPEPINKKRPNESVSKTPVSGKKAKPAAAPASTPQKTGEKMKLSLCFCSLEALDS